MVVFALGLLLIAGVISPALAYSPGFPSSLPVISEAEFGEFRVGETDHEERYDEERNFLELYQAFKCQDGVSGSGFLRVTYFPDDRAWRMFRAYFGTSENNSETWTSYQMECSRKVEVSSEGRIGWSRTVTHCDYINDNGEKTGEETLIDLHYGVVAGEEGHYYVELGVRYYDEGTPGECNLEEIAIQLLNLYLSKIPDNDVFLSGNGTTTSGEGGSSTSSPIPTSSSESIPAKYVIEVISPKDGAHLKQVIDGLFSLPLYAEVRGSGAKDLYAIVTLPDGSYERLPVYNNKVLGVLQMSNPSVKEGKLTVSIYGKVGDGEKLLTKGSVHLSLVSAEVPGDGIDNDMDGLVDCEDPDIATCDACILQKKLEWAESLMERHIAYINKMIETTPSMKSVYDLYIEHLRELHEQYKDDPDRMVKEMNAYMEEKVYRNQEINRYISIFADDPEKRYQLRQIAEKYRYDPIQRRIAMRRFIYENSQTEAEREATMNAILTGILEPPKWLVGGQYGSGGALDWANFVASNFETVGDTVKLKGTETVKMLRTPANIFIVAQDARALMKQAEELKKMNLPESTKVAIIVLDGAAKIGKLLDRSGYFGNMADATLGSLINLRKKIEERNQGWFTWNGYVLHETAKPGIYEDYETGKKFKRVSGGWFSDPVFVEVKENG